LDVYYAQNREDLLIRQFFPDIERGRYVDIGANHPEFHSVSKLFYDAGWSGVNVEPIRAIYDELVAARPRDLNLNVGVSDAPGELALTVYPDADGLSTFNDELAEEYRRGDSFYAPTTRRSVRVMVPVVTIAQLGSEHDLGHVHWMKIDVERLEYEVITGYDWTSVRPELLCIEDSSTPERDWHSHLLAARYQQVFYDGLNRYYLAEEALERQSFFSYPEAVLDRGWVSQGALEQMRSELMPFTDLSARPAGELTGALLTKAKRRLRRLFGR